MRAINRIIIHCAATKGDVSAATIKKWHTETVHKWRDIGYHYVIRFNGTIEVGRPIAESGAHAKGHNRDSIGICLAGGKGGLINYTDAQWHSLRILTEGLSERYDIPDEGIIGHNDVTNRKTCPNFDVQKWWVHDHIVPRA